VVEREEVGGEEEFNDRKNDERGTMNAELNQGDGEDEGSKPEGNVEKDGEAHGAEFAGRGDAGGDEGQRDEEKGREGEDGELAFSDWRLDAKRGDSLEAAASKEGGAERPEHKPARGDAEEVEAGDETGEQKVNRVVAADGKEEAEAGEDGGEEKEFAAVQFSEGERCEDEGNNTDVSDEFGEDDSAVAGKESASKKKWVERERNGFVEGEAAAAQGKAREFKGGDEFDGGEAESQENSKPQNPKLQKRIAHHVLRITYCAIENDECTGGEGDEGSLGMPGGELEGNEQ
jgi:hypothetical protein